MTLPELIAALERGETGPRIDCLIHAELHPDDTILVHSDDGPDPAPVRLRLLDLSREWDWEGLGRLMGAKPLTASLDACAAAMPEGWELFVVDMNPDGRRFVMLRNRDGDWRSGIAPTAPAAWAAAILRAKGGET